MIARVAICRDAATGVQGNPRMLARTRMLRQRIEERGIGVFASQADLKAFLRTLPPAEQTTWSEIATNQRILFVLPDGATTPVHEHDDLATLRKDYGTEADLVVCGHDHARQIGLDDHWLVEESEKPAVGALPDVDGAEELNPNRRANGTSDIILAGTPREDVWRANLAAPAQFAERIAVIDRYAYGHEIERKRVSTGLQWMLQRVLTERRIKDPLRLDLVVEAISDRPIEEQLRDAPARFNLARYGSHFRAINIWIASKEFAIKYLHDRFVQFDGRVLRMTTGMAVLADERVHQQATIAPGWFSDTKQTLDELTASGTKLARWRRSSGVWTDQAGCFIDVAEPS